MSYTLEGKDIVIKGFQDGIADSPYNGISDIRNVDLISIPGEASVAFATTNSVTQVSGSGVVFTADSTTDVFTYSGTPALENNTAVTVVNSGGALPTGLVLNRPYYILNKTATTFQLAASATGAAINISDNGTGTQSFSTINMAKPKFFTTSFSTNVVTAVVTYLYLLVDDNGRTWYYYQGSQWVYLNNLNGDETSAGSTFHGNGLVASWKYLFVFKQQVISYIQLLDASYNPQSLSYLSTYTNWTQSWQTMVTNAWLFTNVPNDINHQAIVGKTDNVVYFCNINNVGSIIQNAGTTFDPSNAATYTYNRKALALPDFEIAQCIGQLDTNILVGGVSNVVYSWDRISPGYNPIFIAENNTARIVSTNTTAYFFTGQRGRIYECNGSQAQLYKKMPDHLSNTVNPYYTWGDALSSRNQLYFGVQATDNAGTAINQYGGVWAIDLDSKAIRLVNQMSYGSYAGIVSAITSLLGPTTSDGFGLLMGWYTGSNSVGSVDKGSPTPYTGGQSYVDSDFIPVATYVDPFTPSQVEWKTSVPLVSGESVALYYRTKLSDAYTLMGTTNTVGAFSDLYKAGFQKAQWVQIRAVLTSTASTPSYCRLTEFRIRDWPSNK